MQVAGKCYELGVALEECVRTLRRAGSVRRSPGRQASHPYRGHSGAYIVSIVATHEHDVLSPTRVFDRVKWRHHVLAFRRSNVVK